MAKLTRPVRSLLYIPASRERAMEKAKDLACDGILFDLEDAVAPEEKVAARALVVETLRDGDYGKRLRIVRINGFDTEWGQADARALAEAVAQGVGIDAVLVPKVGSYADLEAVAAITGDLPLWAMMETAVCMLNAADVARHPKLQGMVMGTNDLAKELGARNRADRLPMMTGLGLCLLAARAYGQVIVDGVYNAFKDDAGLAAECELGRDMGFDGKSLIHPAQLDIANTAFAPSPADIDLANRQIEAYEAALATGQAVAVVDGKIVENLHVVTAKTLLAKAAAIAELAA